MPSTKIRKWLPESARAARAIIAFAVYGFEAAYFTVKLSINLVLPM